MQFGIKVLALALAIVWAAAILFTGIMNLIWPK